MIAALNSTGLWESRNYYLENLVLADNASYLLPPTETHIDNHTVDPLMAVLEYMTEYMYNIRTYGFGANGTTLNGNETIEIV